eukprot:scaffold329090_cov10-Prasinocladus_malaysianus.AAC.1
MRAFTAPRVHESRRSDQARASRTAKEQLKTQYFLFIDLHDCKPLLLHSVRVQVVPTTFSVV